MSLRPIRLGLFGLLVVGCFVLTPIAKVQNGDGPKVIKRQAPVYPAIAHAARARGTVVVDVQIDAIGKVSLATVNRGHPLLAAASRDAALKWRFEVPNIETTRKVSLSFDFDPNVCTGNSIVVSPYHLRIEAPKEAKPPETVSYLPQNPTEQFCPVHKTRLRRDTVDIVYGLVGFKPGYEEAEKDLFPNPNVEAFGGCVIETQINCDGTTVQSSPKYAEVLFCSACRRAKAKCSKTHPWPKA